MANLSLHIVEEVRVKTMISIEILRLFPTRLIEWNGFNPANKKFAKMKAHV